MKLSHLLIVALCDFVTIQSITFADGTPVGSFTTPGLPPSGPPDVASAGSDIHVFWVLDTSGLQYHISSTATSGTSTQGLMTLTYDTFDDTGSQIGFGDTVDARLFDELQIAEVDVTAGSTAAPEPASAGLIGIGCAVLAAGWKARQRRTPVRTGSVA